MVRVPARPARRSGRGRSGCEPRRGVHGLARGSSRRSRPEGHACSSSRTSTGPIARCSSSSSTSSTGACRCRCSSSAPRGPSSSSGSRAGAEASATRRRSRSRRSRRKTPAGCSRSSSTARSSRPRRSSVLLERAGGNPLYAEQFARMLAERGDVAGLAVPETVQALMTARLDTLRPEQKTLLHDAAVVGRIFWSGAVAAIGGRASPVASPRAERARPPRVRPPDARLLDRRRGRVRVLARARPRRRLPADPALTACGQARRCRSLDRADGRRARRRPRRDPRLSLRRGSRAGAGRGSRASGRRARARPLSPPRGGARIAPRHVSSRDVLPACG